MSFDEIRRAIDIVAVVESYGIALKARGKEYVGFCPFHQDTKKPNLNVNREKGVFRCFGCEAKGSAVRFVSKKEGVTMSEAKEKLRASIPGIRLASELPAKAVPVVVPDGKLLAAAVEHYHETLFGNDGRGFQYLKNRGLGDVEMLRHFKIGFANGSLKRKLSPAQIKALGALFNDRGNERFYLRVVVPIFDEHGQPVGLYGRSVQPDAEVSHLYLAGEHRGVWNGAAAAAYSDELIVTEAILDGLAIFQAGKKNVVACYGAGGWTPHHDALVQKHGVRKLVYAFDNDEAGERAARELAQTQDGRGIRCHRIKWPDGVKDACDHFAYHRASDFKGTPETFASLLSAAPRFGFVRPSGARLTLAERTEGGALFQNGTVNYRVKELGGAGLRIVLTARKEEDSSLAHIDNIDLYGARSRKGFAHAAAARLEVEPQKIEEDLLALLESLETLQEQTALESSPAKAPAMTEEEKDEALALLRAPDLLARIASDLELAGYVGEARNKKLAYLIGTSRRLSKPLSAIFRAQSGVGKSFLMECVAELMPPEDVHYFSRLTPQALYYLEPDALTHKLLIVDERDGSEESEYPIRTLQTRRVLKLAVPIKDPSTGKIKTAVLEIHGPIAYMESTTDQRINPENANRCFELYLDEGEAQTLAIFAAQRRARTLEGWKHERQRAAVLRVHHNAQRLLRPLKVIIPFVDLIDFPAAWLRGRRDNDRFLSLIEGIAFLHQHQRTVASDGDAEYIVAALEDYAAAYDLAHQVFADSADDLVKPVRDFLVLVEAVIAGEGLKHKARVEEVWFTRRMIREATRLPDHMIKRHMREIEDLEYVQVQRAPSGGSFRYRLLPGKKTAAVLGGLLTPEALKQKAEQAGQKRKSVKTAREGR